MSFLEASGKCEDLPPLAVTSRRKAPSQQKEEAKSSLLPNRALLTFSESVPSSPLSRKAFLGTAPLGSPYEIVLSSFHRGLSRNASDPHGNENPPDLSFYHDAFWPPPLFRGDGRRGTFFSTVQALWSPPWSDDLPPPDSGWL